MRSNTKTRKAAQDYEQIAVELVRAVRGRRSCAEMSRRGGYKSNAVQRWEALQAWPTAARFLQLHAGGRSLNTSWIQRFYGSVPNWAETLAPTSPAAVGAFLRSLKGGASLVSIAELAERNRFSVSRWFDASAEPKLPDFLRLVDVMSGRLLDLIAALTDPARLPSLRDDWTLLKLAQEAAYDVPWSHGVLRALELAEAPQGVSAQKAWLARTLSLDLASIAEALNALEKTDQLAKSRKGYTLQSVGTKVDTSRDPLRARDLKAAWIHTALERLRTGDSGRYGYSVFSVSHADLRRIHQLHLEYVRSMQAIVASSSPNECVGLYCSQLLNLSGRDL